MCGQQRNSPMADPFFGSTRWGPELDHISIPSFSFFRSLLGPRSRFGPKKWGQPSENFAAGPWLRPAKVPYKARQAKVIESNPALRIAKGVCGTLYEGKRFSTAAKFLRWPTSFLGPNMDLKNGVQNQIFIPSFRSLLGPRFGIQVWTQKWGQPSENFAAAHRGFISRSATY